MNKISYNYDPIIGPCDNQPHLRDDLNDLLLRIREILAKFLDSVFAKQFELQIGGNDMKVASYGARVSWFVGKNALVVTDESGKVLGRLSKRGLIKQLAPELFDKKLTKVSNITEKLFDTDRASLQELQDSLEAVQSILVHIAKEEESNLDILEASSLSSRFGFEVEGNRIGVVQYAKDAAKIVKGKALAITDKAGKVIGLVNKENFLKTLVPTLREKDRKMVDALMTKIIDCDSAELPRLQDVLAKLREALKQIVKEEVVREGDVYIPVGKQEIEPALIPPSLSHFLNSIMIQLTDDEGEKIGFLDGKTLVEALVPQLKKENPTTVKKILKTVFDKETVSLPDLARSLVHIRNLLKRPIEELKPEQLDEVSIGSQLARRALLKAVRDNEGFFEDVDDPKMRLHMMAAIAAGAFKETSIQRKKALGDLKVANEQVKHGGKRDDFEVPEEVRQKCRAAAVAAQKEYQAIKLEKAAKANGEVIRPSVEELLAARRKIVSTPEKRDAFLQQQIAGKEERKLKQIQLTELEMMKQIRVNPLMRIAAKEHVPYNEIRIIRSLINGRIQAFKNLFEAFDPLLQDPKDFSVTAIDYFARKTASEMRQILACVTETIRDLEARGLANNYDPEMKALRDQAFEISAKLLGILAAKGGNVTDAINVLITDFQDEDQIEDWVEEGKISMAEAIHVVE